MLPRGRSFIQVRTAWTDPLQPSFRGVGLHGVRVHTRGPSHPSFGFLIVSPLLSVSSLPSPPYSCPLSSSPSPRRVTLYSRSLRSGFSQQVNSMPPRFALATLQPVTGQLRIPRSLRMSSTPSFPTPFPTPSTTLRPPPILVRSSNYSSHY
jgi:hypothetical protein